MATKRILIFSLMYHPYESGAEMAVRFITDQISKEEIEFDLIALRADANLPRIERVGNVTIHRIGPSKKGITFEDLSRFPWYLVKVLYVPLAVLKACSLSRGKPYNAYWSLMTNMGFPVVLLRKFFRDMTPYILTLQDGDTTEYITKRRRIRLFSGLLKRIFTEATVVQAISKYLAQFAKDMGYPGEPVVIPNGVEFERFASTKHTKETNKLIYALNKKPNEVYLVTTSRLVEKNALGDVIAALSKLPERVKFLVLGAGPLGERLWKEVVSKGLQKRVRFCGQVDTDLVPAYLQVSDIFVRPALSEGMGSSFLEAMAAGIPIVATRVGGIPDFLIDPESPLGKVAPTGLFCEVKNPESIASAVVRLMENDVLRKKIVKNAREMVRVKYGWDTVARDMREKVFVKVI
ncbi:MAG: glycosyltransferase family 4 protein [Patescibacteria group bacterium]